jgi:hypothetical protein
MKKKDIEIGKVYNLKFYKTMTVPVKIFSLGTYRVEIQYLDSKTLEPRAVPNPPFFGATTEYVAYSLIKDEYAEAN